MGKNKLDADSVLELNDLFNKIKGIDLKAVEMEKLEAMRPVDRLVEDLKNDRKVVRKLKDRTGNGRTPKPKVHYQTRRKRQREYYHNTTKPKRTIQKAELLTTPEGWWEYLTTSWKRKKVPVEMTKEEWLEVVWPILDGRLFVVRRYNVNGPISLENIYLQESGTTTTLFDGTEWKLQQLGYIL